MKKASPILLILTLALCLPSAFPLSDSPRANPEIRQDSQEAGTHPALKQDLVSEAGEKILEVVEASYQTTPDSLDSSSVRVKNLSGKNVTALGLVWTLKFTDGKTCQIDQLVDYRLHMDIVNEKGARAFAPYEEKSIPRLAKESFNGGQRIESVKVEFAFAEFEDAGGIKIEKSEMYKHLLSKREGAGIYKHWLEDGYEDDPQKLDVVVKKLLGGNLPNDGRLENEMVQQGALVYKQWMLGLLKEKGVDALRERLRLHRQPLGQR